MQELRRVFKKSLCVILVIVTTMISSVCYVRADGGYSLSDLKNCTNIYSYSGKNNAYFYGNDENVRKVIPHYDEIYEQIFSVITTYCGDKPLAVLDTGCGTGNFGVIALNRLNLSELLLCDPSEKMLADARKKLANQGCEFHCIGSENLEFSNRFDVVTAIQSHHYFDRATRETAVQNCFNALKPGGIFICFENTAPFTERGKDLLLKRIEAFGLAAGRTPDEVRSHSARYNTEYFPITIKEHLELLEKTGFAVCELFWHSYMQSGFYAIKG